MGTNHTFNGTSYLIPDVNDVAWGAAVTNLLSALCTYSFTTASSSWHLITADLDLGSSYGIVSKYFTTKTATPALSGAVRLAKTDVVAWRNNANSGDLPLGIDTSNFVTFNSIRLADLSTAQTFTNKTIDASLNTLSNITGAMLTSNAGITYSQLNIADGSLTWAKTINTGVVVDANVSAAAAIQYSKILVPAGAISWASVDHVGKIVNADLTGTAGITYANLTINDGDLSWAKTSHNGVIVNADINASAAIATSKLSNDWAARDLITSGALKLGSTYHVSVSSNPNADYNFIFPTAAGSVGQALVWQTGGNMAWATIPGLALLVHNMTIGNVSSLPASVDTNAVGDILGDATNGLTIKALAITNAMLSANAAIAHSKMAALTASVVPVTDASGFVTSSATTATELGYLHGVTSAIQTQIGTKMAAVGSAVVSGNIPTFSGTTGAIVADSGAKLSDYATTGSLSGYIPKISSSIDKNFTTWNSTTGGLIQDSGLSFSVDTTLAANSDLIIPSQKAIKAYADTKASPLGYTAAHAGANADITSLSSLSTALSIAQGGTGGTTALTAMQSLGAETVFNGLENPSAFGVAYSASTKIFTVTYTGTAAYTVSGVRYTATGTATTTAHAATNGLWYLYYNSAGVLTVSQTIWDLFITAPLAQIYYTTSNAGGAASAILMDERHPGTSGMPNATHLYLHTTRGTQLFSGCKLSGITLTTLGAANINWAMSAGSIADEDLILSTTAQLLGGANTYRIFYKTGTSASPAWNWVDRAESGIYSDGTNIYYNQLTGGSWQLTAANVNARFINYWVIANTSLAAPQIVVLMGQALYTTLATAQNATFTAEMSDLSILTNESIVLYQITYERKTTGVPGNCQVDSYAAVTQSQVSVASGSILIAANVLVTAAGFSGILSPTDTTCQQALQTIDVWPTAVKQITNKDIDGLTASDTSRITVPKAAAATLAGLTRKQATIAYDTDKAALVVDDGASFKTIGGGLAVVYHAAVVGEDGMVATGTPLATTGGNLYQYNLGTYNGYARLPQGSTVLATSTATMGFKTFGNNTNGKLLVIEGYAGTETITYGSVAYTSLTLLPVNGWFYLTYDATNSTWLVQDQAQFVSGTFAGDIAFTGKVNLIPIATPANPSSSNDVNIYVKGGKIIFQYNDGGTVRWKSLDLSGTGVTWVAATSAP